MQKIIMLYKARYVKKWGRKGEEVPTKKKKKKKIIQHAITSWHVIDENDEEYGS